MLKFEAEAKSLRPRPEVTKPKLRPKFWPLDDFNISGAKRTV